MPRRRKDLSFSFESSLFFGPFALAAEAGAPKKGTAEDVVVVPKPAEAQSLVHRSRMVDVREEIPKRW